MIKVSYRHCPSSKIFSLIILVFVLLLSTIKANAETPQIRVGVIVPLTGGLATIGNALKNGIELARSEYPDRFQRIAFIYEDDQYDSKKSVAAYQKLKQIDGVNIVFGFGDSLGYSVGAISERDKMPLINFNFDAGPAKGKQFLVRAMNHTEQYVDKLASFLLQSGSPRWSIVRADSSFFDAMTKSLIRRATGKVEIGEPIIINPEERDFKSTILRLKQSNPGAVGLFIGPDQLLNFVKQAELLKFKATYFGTDLFETAVSISTNTDTFSGCIYADNEVSSLFRKNYLDAYNNEAQQTFAGSGYDMALLVAEAFKANPNSDNLSLMNFFRQIENRTGVLGNFSFVSESDRGMYFKYPVRVKKIQGKIGLSIN